MPQVKESEGIVPTSSTTTQLALGDALAIATMKYKNFDIFYFKKINPSGSICAQLKTVEYIMVKKKDIPFVNENLIMKKALKILSEKKLGILIVRNKNNFTKGIITDGQIRRFNQKKRSIQSLKVKEIMTKNPISVEKNCLAAKALSIMNSKKITSLCIYENKNKQKTIGVVHIHAILNNNIFK